jgi:hypothetical protein
MLHEMTRTTSAERAKLVRVESHDVALDLTRDDEHFGATPVIRFSGLRPGAAGHADLRAGKVPRLLAPYAALFPYTAASPELLSQIDEFLADPALEPALARIVTECRNVVEKAWRVPDAAGLTVLGRDRAG